MTTLLINNITSEIAGISSTIAEILHSELSFAIPGAEYSKLVREHKWDGRKRLFNKRYSRFPTGLAHLVVNILKDYDISYEVVDRRNPVECGVPLPVKWTLRDYQLETVEKALEVQRGIVKLPTGSGKSICIAALVGRLNVPTLVLCHRQDLLVQLKATISGALGIEVGELWGNKKKLLNINIATVQTMDSLLKRKAWDPFYKQLVDWMSYTCACLVLDEVHVSTSGDYQRVTNRCYNAKYRYGFSATPMAAMGGTMLLESCTARIFMNLTISDLVKRGHLAKPYAVFVDIPRAMTVLGKPPSALRSVAQTPSPSLLSNKPVEGQSNEFREAREDAITNNVYRNKLIATIASRFMSEGKRVLISVQYLVHGKLLYEQIVENIIRQKYKEGRKRKLRELDISQLAYVKGEDLVARRKDVLEKLNTGELLCVIATSIFGVGVDVPELNVIINTKAQESEVDYFQVVGRAFRKTPTKTQALIVDFIDHYKFFQSKALNRRELLRKEEKIKVFTIDARNVLRNI